MKRNFSIGSEWLYYKIYTGVKTADILLVEKLYPIILDLQEKHLIEKWFFIRYNDSKEHLRIRFLIQNPENLIVVIGALYPVLNEMQESDLIWKIQTDTYHREMERYGEITIEESETLFWYDSVMILKYLELKPYFLENKTELLFTFLAIDSFLNAFKVSISEKLNLMNALQLAYKKEFEADKNLKKELDKHFRDLLPEMQQFLNGNSINDYPDIFEIIQERNNQINATVHKIKKKIQLPIQDFIMSHIHMSINRQFTSNQRKYELIIYDHLFRYFKLVSFANEK